MDSLLTTSNDEDLGISSIEVLCPLLLPADVACHMPIVRRDFWELLQLLGNGVHRVYSPALFGEYSIDDRRRNNEFCVE